MHCCIFQSSVPEYQNSMCAIYRYTDIPIQYGVFSAETPFADEEGLTFLFPEQNLCSDETVFISIHCGLAVRCFHIINRALCYSPKSDNAKMLLKSITTMPLKITSMNTKLHPTGLSELKSAPVSLAWLWQHILGVFHYSKRAPKIIFLWPIVTILS